MRRFFFLIHRAMKRVFLYIFSLLLVTSCATCRNCRSAVLNSVDCKDSVVIRETIVYRDTLIPVAVKDSTSKDRTVPKDTARAETDLARAKAWLERDSLKLTISNKPSPIPLVKAKLPEKARTELHTKTITEIKTFEVNRLTKWQKTMISLGYVFIGFILLVLIGKLSRLRKTIISTLS